MKSGCAWNTAPDAYVYPQQYRDAGLHAQPMCREASIREAVVEATRCERSKPKEPVEIVRMQFEGRQCPCICISIHIYILMYFYSYDLMCMCIHAWHSVFCLLRTYNEIPGASVACSGFLSPVGSKRPITSLAPSLGRKRESERETYAHVYFWDPHSNARTTQAG